MAAAALFVLDGAGIGRTFSIDEEVTIGRSREADITLTDGEVSRTHFKARCEGETLVVEDLGSSNGTFVNDQPVEGPVRMREGDVIRAGSTKMEFRYETTQIEDGTPTEATSVHRSD